MDINLLLVPIRQMAALVRRTLAEVCTAPLLLVTHVFSTGLKDVASIPSGVGW